MVTFDGTCQTDTSESFANLETIMLNSLKTKEPAMKTKVSAASAPLKTPGFPPPLIKNSVEGKIDASNCCDAVPWSTLVLGLWNIVLFPVTMWCFGRVFEKPKWSKSFKVIFAGKHNINSLVVAGTMYHWHWHWRCWPCMIKSKVNRVGPLSAVGVVSIEPAQKLDDGISDNCKWQDMEIPRERGNNCVLFWQIL